MFVKVLLLVLTGLRFNSDREVSEFSETSSLFKFKIFITGQVVYSTRTTIYCQSNSKQEEEDKSKKLFVVAQYAEDAQ